MFDATYPSGQEDRQCPEESIGQYDPDPILNGTDVLSSYDDNALMADPDGDIFAWDDEDDEDDDFDDDDAGLEDDFDDDSD